MNIALLVGDHIMTNIALLLSVSMRISESEYSFIPIIIFIYISFFKPRNGRTYVGLGTCAWQSFVTGNSSKEYSFVSCSSSNGCII